MTVSKSLKKNRNLLRILSQEIWRNPELNYEETFAHKLLTSTLENAGFLTKRHYILPTAFRAEFNSEKEGPTIAVICEYDALPGIGHACGHNLIAEIGVGVGLAVKEAMETNSTIGGKIIVLGTPAEEGGGGKIKLIEKGAFKDIDAAMMAHPQLTNRLVPLIVECNNLNVKFNAQPGGDPWEGPSAVDAAVALYNNIALVRRTIKEKWRISLSIPTSCCDHSEVRLNYRAPTISELRILKEKIEACIIAAAQSTDCCYRMECKDDDQTYKGMIYNMKMVEIFEKHAKAVGIEFHDSDPQYAESAVSTDMGNVTHVVPGMQPEYHIGAESPHLNHTVGFAEAANSEGAQEYTLVIAEALAKTVIDLMSNPKLMQEIKEEFEKSPLRDHEYLKRKVEGYA